MIFGVTFYDRERDRENKVEMGAPQACPVQEEDEGS